MAKKISLLALTYKLYYITNLKWYKNLELVKPNSLSCHCCLHWLHSHSKIFLVVKEAGPRFTSPAGILVAVLMKVMRENRWATEEHAYISAVWLKKAELCGDVEKGKNLELMRWAKVYVGWVENNLFVHMYVINVCWFLIRGYKCYWQALKLRFDSKGNTLNSEMCGMIIMCGW